MATWVPESRQAEVAVTRPREDGGLEKRWRLKASEELRQVSVGGSEVWRRHGFMGTRVFRGQRNCFRRKSLILNKSKIYWEVFCRSVHH